MMKQSIKKKWDNKMNILKRVTDLGVSAITTNRPKWLREQLK